jgi:hypothetical protein
MNPSVAAITALLLAAVAWTVGLTLPAHPLLGALAAAGLAGVAILVMPTLVLGRPDEQAVDVLAEAKAAGVEPERLLSVIERIIEEDGETPRKTP